MRARQAIYRYVEHPWPAGGGRVAGAVQLRGDETIADVGCGNGNDLRDLRRAGHEGRLFAFDLSVGMLRSVDLPGVPSINADAARLPLRDGAVDAALAMHMLYHCPDLDAVVAELRRVVRQGGVLVASTNSLDHLRELRDAWSEALAAASADTADPWRTAATRFSLEAGAPVLQRAFGDVEVQRTDNRLLVPEPAPVLAYVASTRDLSGAGIDDATWDAALRLLGEEVDATIRREGAFAITVVKGIFVCR